MAKINNLITHCTPELGKPVAAMSVVADFEYGELSGVVGWISGGGVRVSFDGDSGSWYELNMDRFFELCVQARERIAQA